MSVFTPVGILSDKEISTVLKKIARRDVFKDAGALHRRPMLSTFRRELAARRIRIISAGLASNNDETCTLALEALDYIPVHSTAPLHKSTDVARDALFMQALGILRHGSSTMHKMIAENIVDKWHKEELLPNRNYDDALRHCVKFFSHKDNHMESAAGMTENYSSYIWQTLDGNLFYRGGCLKSPDIREVAERRIKVRLADKPPEHSGYAYRQHRNNTKLPALIRGVTLLADIDMANAREHAVILHEMVTDPESRLRPEWYARFQPLVDDLARAAKGEPLLNPPVPAEYPSKARALKALADSKAIFG